MAPKILAHTINLGGSRKLVIYARPENINFFLTTPLVPDVTEPAASQLISYSGSSRRRYPGDSAAYEVPGGSRLMLKDPGRRSAKALPGRNFTLLQIADDTVPERREFTYKGAFIDLHSLIEARAAFDMTLYSSRGTPYDILAAVAP